jgi:hypothetical protein
MDAAPKDLLADVVRHEDGVAVLSPSPTKEEA